MIKIKYKTIFQNVNDRTYKLIFYSLILMILKYNVKDMILSNSLFYIILYNILYNLHNSG